VSGAQFDARPANKFPFDFFWSTLEKKLLAAVRARPLFERAHSMCHKW
jgi:hypothetical protein